MSIGIIVHLEKLPNIPWKRVLPTTWNRRSVKDPEQTYLKVCCITPCGLPTIVHQPFVHKQSFDGIGSPHSGKLGVSLVSAAAAKSRQSCPTLCHPIDGSPPGSPVPGILQARTLEWVAISFSNEWKWKVKVKSLSRVRLLATPWTAAHQAPPSMGFPRQTYWNGVPLPSPSPYPNSLGLSRWFSGPQSMGSQSVGHTHTHTPR